MASTLGTRRPPGIRAGSGWPVERARVSRTGSVVAGPSVVGAGLCQHRAMSPTVLVVDDHASFRAAASALLEAEGYTVVGGAGDGDEALTQVGALRPDVVLLDVQLPGIDGFEVARRLAALAARSPARGFLDKRALSGAALTRLLQ